MFALTIAFGLALLGGIVFAALGFVLWRIDRRFPEQDERDGGGAGRRLMVFGLWWSAVAAVLSVVLFLLT